MVGYLLDPILALEGVTPVPARLGSGRQREGGYREARWDPKEVQDAGTI